MPIKTLTIGGKKHQAEQAQRAVRQNPNQAENYNQIFGFLYIALSRFSSGASNGASNG